MSEIEKSKHDLTPEEEKSVGYIWALTFLLFTSITLGFLCYIMQPMILILPNLNPIIGRTIDFIFAVIMAGLIPPALMYMVNKASQIVRCIYSRHKKTRP